MPVFIIETEEEITKDQVDAAITEAVRAASGLYSVSVTVIQLR